MRPAVVRLIVLFALIAASVGCSGGESSGDTSAPQPEAVISADAQSATAGGTALSAEVALADLLEATERLAATTFRFEVANGFEGEELGVDGGLVTTGEFDGEWSATRSIAIEDGQESPIAMEGISNDTIGFLYTPGFPQTADNPLALATQDWVEVNLVQIEQELGVEFSVGVTAFEAFENMRSMFTSDSTIIEGEASESRGVPTRTFSFTVVPPPTEDSDLFGPADTDVVVHIDADGWIRQVDGASRSFIQRVEFFDIGQAIAVDVPADAADITDELLELSAG